MMNGQKDKQTVLRSKIDRHTYRLIEGTYNRQRHRLKKVWWMDRKRGSQMD
jgi:hypothetical protein